MPAARGAGEVEPARQECNTSLPHGWHGPVGLVVIADSKDLQQQGTRTRVEAENPAKCSDASKLIG